MGIILASFLLMSAIIYQLIEYKLEQQTISIKEKTLSQNKKINVVSSLPTSQYNNVEEIEREFILSCRQTQSLILTCRHCYLEGNNYCPYPTDSFCQSIYNLDESDPNIAWGFLPNNEDYVYKVKNLLSKDPTQAQTQDDLKLVIRYKLQNTLDWGIVDTKLKYHKPTNTGTDPCAVEGVITY